MTPSRSEHRARVTAERFLQALDTHVDIYGVTRRNDGRTKREIERSQQNVDNLRSAFNAAMYDFRAKDKGAALKLAAEVEQRINEIAEGGTSE